MAIWDFGSFDIEDLERLIEIQDELEEMGLDSLFDEDMMLEVCAELQKRMDKLDDDLNPRNGRPDGWHFHFVFGKGF
jgi:hypothetical protein